jgi:hypothetical protein
VTDIGPERRRATPHAALPGPGLDPKSFSAHSLRAGYLTEIPGAFGMQQSQHRRSAGLELLQ